MVEGGVLVFADPNGEPFVIVNAEETEVRTVFLCVVEDGVFDRLRKTTGGVVHRDTFAMGSPDDEGLFDDAYRLAVGEKTHHDGVVLAHRKTLIETVDLV